MTQFGLDVNSDGSFTFMRIQEEFTYIAVVKGSKIAFKLSFTDSKGDIEGNFSSSNLVKIKGNPIHDGAKMFRQVEAIIILILDTIKPQEAFKLLINSTPKGVHCLN